MTHFHNTIAESGDTLVAHNITCETQEQKILDIFKQKGSEVSMTPFYVLGIYEKLYHRFPPITSIRRAMSNLTEQNKLIKTQNMKKEYFGKKNFLWKYNDSFGK